MAKLIPYVSCKHTNTIPTRGGTFWLYSQPKGNQYHTSGMDQQTESFIISAFKLIYID